MPEQVPRGQGSELREPCKEATSLSALAAARRSDEDDSGTFAKPTREDHGKEKTAGGRCVLEGGVAVTCWVRSIVAGKFHLLCDSV